MKILMIVSLMLSCSKNVFASTDYLKQNQENNSKIKQKLDLSYVDHILNWYELKKDYNSALEFTKLIANGVGKVVIGQKTYSFNGVDESIYSTKEQHEKAFDIFKRIGKEHIDKYDEIIETITPDSKNAEFVKKGLDEGVDEYKKYLEKLSDEEFFELKLGNDYMKDIMISAKELYEKLGTNRYYSEQKYWYENIIRSICTPNKKNVDGLKEKKFDCWGSWNPLDKNLHYDEQIRQIALELIERLGTRVDSVNVGIYSSEDIKWKSWEDKVLDANKERKRLKEKIDII